MSGGFLGRKRVVGVLALAVLVGAYLVFPSDPDLPPLTHERLAAAAPLGAASTELDPSDRAALIARLKARLRDDNLKQLLVRNVPPALAGDAGDVDLRKRLFIRAVLPSVLQVNAWIAEDRRVLGRLAAKERAGEALSQLERDWIGRAKSAYDLSEGRGTLADLGRRLGPVPPSIALAQGAIESGWGGSRFAQEGNALFGQWTWSGEGIEPEDREPGQTHRIQAFDNITASVYAYMNNLNTHGAYGAFRHLRSEALERGGPWPIEALTGALEDYSERGEAYVALVRDTIEDNRLVEFDNIPGVPGVPVASAPGGLARIEIADGGGADADGSRIARPGR